MNLVFDDVDGDGVEFCMIRAVARIVIMEASLLLMLIALEGKKRSLRW